MATNLEVTYEYLQENSGAHDIVWVIVPRFAVEMARSFWHRLYYELPRIQHHVTRDAIERLLDAGETGMSDVLLMGDFIHELQTMNGHLSHIGNALYHETASEEVLSIADLVAQLEGMGSEDAWTIEDVAEALELLAALVAAL